MLPGYQLAESICLLTVGKKLTEVDATAQKKVVKLWDSKQSKEMPKEVDMWTSLIGQTVKVALVEQTVDRRAKGNDGVYRPTGETRDENVIASVMRHKDNRTVNEVLQKVDATFHDEWIKAHQGKKRNKLDKDSPARNPATAAAVREGAPADTTFADL